VSRPPSPPPAPPAAPVRDLASWLAACLPPRLAETVRAAYAFDSPDPSPERHAAPLRDLARRFGVSRERARQLLARAHGLLAARPAIQAASALFAAAARILEARRGVVEPADLAATEAFRVPEWSGASPVAAFLLLGRVRPGAPPVAVRGFFSRFSPAAVDAVADALDALADALRADPAPLRPFSAVAARLPRALPVPAAARPALVAALAARSPKFLLSRNGRCGNAAACSAALVRALLARHPDSTLPALVERFNALVVPSSQIGLGRLRAIVLADPAIHRSSPSHYALLPAPD